MPHAALATALSRSALPLLAALLASGCSTLQRPGSDTAPLPTPLAGKAQLLTPADPDHARAVVTAAVKPAGQGGVTQALVVRITQDLPVYRMWSGPDRKDSAGRTNRIGGWWSYDAPRGSVTAYRQNYEICMAWNELRWVATCTLKAGAVVAIGPGQSVSAETCGDPTGKETYAANPRDWQLYLDKPWTRPAELVCPPDSQDYEADPTDISRRKPG